MGDLDDMFWKWLFSREQQRRKRELAAESVAETAPERRAVGQS